MNLEYLLEDDLYEISEESVKGIIKKGYALLLDLLTRIFHKLEEIKSTVNIRRAIQHLYKNINKVPLDERFDYIVKFAYDMVGITGKRKYDRISTAYRATYGLMLSVITKLKTEYQLKSFTRLYDSIKQKDWNSLNDDYIHDVLKKLTYPAYLITERKKAELSLPDETSGIMEKCIKLWFNCTLLLLRKTLRFYRSNKDQWRMTDEQKEILRCINNIRYTCDEITYVLKYFEAMTK